MPSQSLTIGGIKMALYHYHCKKHGKPDENHWHIVQAKSFKKAIEKIVNFYFDNYNGEGSFYLDTTKPITKLPYCKLIFVGKIKGNLCCGPLKILITHECLKYEEGTHGTCILGTKIYDPEKKCCFYKLPFHPHSPKFPGEKWKEKEITMNGYTYKIIDLSRKSPKGSFLFLLWTILLLDNRHQGNINCIDI